MDLVSPITKVRISAKQKYIEPWMTRGIEISGQQKLCLYRETLKASAMCKDIMKYKVYQGSRHEPPGPLGGPFGTARTKLSGGQPPRVLSKCQPRPHRPLSPSALLRV